jgi:hypothetical protein
MTWESLQSEAKILCKTDILVRKRSHFWFPMPICTVAEIFAMELATLARNAETHIYYIEGERAMP